MFMPESKLFGGHIAETLYKPKDEDRVRFIKLKCDVYLLRLLSRPTTVYDVIRKMGYAHSSAYYTLRQYHEQGIIENVRTERLPSGLTKKYYKLTDIGLSLLYVVERIIENYHGNPLRKRSSRKICSHSILENTSSNNTHSYPSCSV